MTVGDDLERVARERDEAREELAAMHRRAQRAESIIAQAGLVDGRPQGEHGRSLGRALANFAADQYRRERDEAREEVRRLRAELAEAEDDLRQHADERLRLRVALMRAERERDEARERIGGGKWVKTG